MARYDEETLVLWFNMAQDAFARDTLWFDDGFQEYPLKDNQREYGFPIDYIEAREMHYRFEDGTRDLIMKKASLRLVRHQQFLQAIPRRYAKIGNKFIIDSNPTDQSGTIILDYYRTPVHVQNLEEVSGQQHEIPIRFVNAVNAYATWLALEADEDESRADRYLKMYNVEVSRAIVERQSITTSPQHQIDTYDEDTGTFLDVL